VKNTLAMVQGFASLTLKNSSPAEFREALMGRILALAAAHDLLTRSRWRGASLQELVSAELASFNRPQSGRIVWEGEDVALTSRQALGLGMVIHELATNAAKHGALSMAAGRISLRWRKLNGSDPESLEIVWVERGGPPVTRPSRTGFGSRLIGQTVSADLLGSIDTSFKPEGLVCRIVIPIASPLSPADQT
jgi:two-component sensor histidine kinase